MKKPLKALLVEDNDSDARLIVRELHRAGYEVDCTRIQTEDEYRAQLDRGYQIILSDYTLPQFSAPAALAILRARDVETPFIVITGTATEETVVECMHEGADDYLIKDRLGRLGQAVARAIDARRAERELREERDFISNMVDMSPTFILALGADGKTLMMSDAMLRALGYERDEVIGHDYLSMFVPEPDRQMLEELFDQMREGGVATANENRVLARDGRALLVEWHRKPVYSQDGTFSHLFGVGIDITERRRAEEALRSSEEQLRQSQKMEAVGRLAGGIAHDFNNLLTAINGYSELVLRRLAEDSPLRPMVDEIRQAGERAAELTRHLLAFSRKQAVEPRVLDLNAVVSGIENMLSRLIGEGIVLSASLGSDLGTVIADPSHVEQVVMNLVVNARDAMPDGGRVSIATLNAELNEAHARTHMKVAPGHYVVLTVSDTGTGMDSETRSHIFEPFYTTKGSSEGTGLGLSTVYGIVKQAKGSIRVYSEPGYGTTFKVFLPRTDTPVRPSARSGQVAEGSCRGTVLLVDDEEPVRRFVQEVLDEAGLRVVEARDGHEALTIIRAHEGRIDMLVTDLILSQMNGRELVRRAFDLQSGLKVLVVSGYTADVLTHHGVLAGGMGFLEKPFTADDLLCQVCQML